MRNVVLTTALAAAAAAALSGLAPVASANPAMIQGSDACSPSFNVLFNDPTICNRNGGMPVGVFLQQLQDRKVAGPWRFSPGTVRVDAGASLTWVNRGGETHTLSEVSQFGGGGVVPPLNEILFGVPDPPIFFDPSQVTFVPAGGEEAIPSSTRTPGTHLFQCAIHPWMEATVVVS